MAKVRRMHSEYEEVQKQSQIYRTRMRTLLQAQLEMLWQHLGQLVLSHADWLAHVQQFSDFPQIDVKRLQATLRAQGADPGDQSGPNADVTISLEPSVTAIGRWISRFF